MAIVQSELGPITLLDEFSGGAEAAVGNSDAPPLNIGNGTYQLVGQGLADTDSGAVLTDVLGGGLVLTATNEAEHAIGLTTTKMFDVGLMAPMVFEVRIQQAALVTRQIFFGLTDVQTDLAILEGAIIKGDTVTLTLTASDLCGFLLASELTDAADWHGVFNGGAATGVTVSTDLDLDADAVAATYQILRLEVDPDGTARWYVDGVLKQTQAGAVSTTVDLCMSIICEEKVTGNASMQLNHLWARANRDWTA